MVWTYDADKKRERTPKKMLLTKMEGKGQRGRPRFRCIDEIRNYIEIRGEK